jgi:hypothetical protein
MKSGRVLGTAGCSLLCAGLVLLPASYARTCEEAVGSRRPVPPPSARDIALGHLFTFDKVFRSDGPSNQVFFGKLRVRSLLSVDLVNSVSFQSYNPCWMEL